MSSAWFLGLMCTPLSLAGGGIREEGLEALWEFLSGPARLPLVDVSPPDSLAFAIGSIHRLLCIRRGDFVQLLDTESFVKHQDCQLIEVIGSALD